MRPSTRCGRAGSCSSQAPAAIRASRTPPTGAAGTPRADANVIAMVVELPTSYLGANPDCRVWARCSLLRDGEWIHADRVGHPSLSGILTTEDTVAEYSAGAPSRDRERWMGQLIDVMGGRLGGGYTREEAIEAINAEGTLPDVLTYNPSKPARYPNGRTLTDDAIGYRMAFLTKGGKRPSSGLTPAHRHPPRVPVSRGGAALRIQPCR